MTRDILVFSALTKKVTYKGSLQQQALPKKL